MAKRMKVQAVTIAALDAGTQLAKITGFAAVEAQGRKILAAMNQAAGTGDFAEFHFHGARVDAIAKAGELIVRVNK